MITLYGFKQAFGLVDASPFVLKVDAFLRMAQLPYKLTSSVAYLRKSPKGKLPFIEDGNAKIGDSSFIFEYLNQKPEVTLNDWLSAEQRAQAYLIGKSLDENFYWCLLYSRWICDDNWPKTRQVFFGHLPFPFSSIVTFAVRRATRSALYKQGMGRHSAAEIEHIFNRSLASLSTLLGDKRYIMGERVCELDATVFGMLAQFILADVDSRFNTIARGYPNLQRYCDNFAQRYYGAAA